MTTVDIMGALEVLAVRAASHPVVSLAALSMLGAAAVVDRRMLVLVPTAFLAIAAIVGTEPVPHAGARRLFAIGVFLSIGCYLAAIRNR